jgi:hypothetical protein
MPSSHQEHEERTFPTAASTQNTLPSAQPMKNVEMAPPPRLCPHLVPPIAALGRQALISPNGPLSQGDEKEKKRKKTYNGTHALFHDVKGNFAPAHPQI